MIIINKRPETFAVRRLAADRAPLPSARIVPRPVDAPSSDHRGIESIERVEDRTVDSPTSRMFRAAAAAPPWLVWGGGQTRPFWWLDRILLAVFSPPGGSPVFFGIETLFMTESHKHGSPVRAADRTSPAMVSVVAPMGPCCEPLTSARAVFRLEVDVRPPGTVTTIYLHWTATGYDWIRPGHYHRSSAATAACIACMPSRWICRPTHGAATATALPWPVPAWVASPTPGRCRPPRLSCKAFAWRWRPSQAAGAGRRRYHDPLGDDPCRSRLQPRRSLDA